MNPKSQRSPEGTLPDAPRLLVWRHPKACGATGRCIGQTDLPVDARKAKRLARRIQVHAKRHGLAKVIHTSDLQRSRRVGEWLARWGWQHVVLRALRESDFGEWDGQPWDAIPVSEIDAWARNLAHVRPGGGESVAMLLIRVQAVLACLPAGALVVGHGGWMCAAQWLASAGWPKTFGEGGPLPTGQSWPRAPRNGQLWVL